MAAPRDDASAITERSSFCRKEFFVVGPGRLELPTSGPPAQRTTNCAMARYTANIPKPNLSGGSQRKIIIPEYTALLKGFENRQHGS